MIQTEDLVEHVRIVQRKTVHIELERDTHLKVKNGLTKYAITMQDFFHYLAEEAINNPEFDKICFEAFKRKVEKKKEKSLSNTMTTMGKLDRQTLYDIIGNE